MLLGIDVGGTFTDAVLIKEAKILALGKCTLLTVPFCMEF